MATNYTQELQEMLEEVTLRGNPNKKDVAKLCSVLFRMNERLNEAEAQIIDLTEELKVFMAIKPAKKVPRTQSNQAD